MSNYNNDFRAFVAAKMAARRWKVAELARRAGLKYTTVDTMLKTEGEVHYSKAMAIKDALNGRRVNNEADAA